MLKSFLDLFLKTNCPLCERPASNIVCVYCEKQLKKNEGFSSQKLWKNELPVFIWGNYEGSLKKAIASLKYNGTSNLGELLGYWLGEKWLATSISKKFKKLNVVPIPLHQNKLKIRGYNQAEIIAKAFCQITRYSLKSHGLARVKNTEALFTKNAKEREKELSKALSLGKDFTKKLPSDPVLLLDDIYTTGTTVREAKKILTKYNIKVVGVVAIATSKNF